RPRGDEGNDDDGASPELELLVRRATPRAPLGFALRVTEAVERAERRRWRRRALVGATAFAAAAALVLAALPLRGPGGPEGPPSGWHVAPVDHRGAPWPAGTPLPVDIALAVPASAGVTLVDQTGARATLAGETRGRTQVGAVWLDGGVVRLGGDGARVATQ